MKKSYVVILLNLGLWMSLLCPSADAAGYRFITKWGSLVQIKASLIAPLEPQSI